MFNQRLQADLQQARQAGFLAAARELRRLRVDMAAQVDIFRIIENAPLWLMFQPLGNLLGVYLPGGIMINTQRPRSVQRLTAAHEYGHHVLKHESSLDDESNVEDAPAGRFRPSSRGGLQKLLSRERLLEEAEAQAFATDFLMPPQLVNRLWLDLKVSDGDEEPDAAKIYRLSLFLGTSYTATLRQLVALDKLSLETAQELLSVKPLQIKKSIAGGAKPQDSRADVWPLGESDAGRSVSARVGDELHIELREKPSTGYIWAVGQSDVASQGETHEERFEADHETTRLDGDEPLHDFELVAADFQKQAASDSDAIGSGGKRHFVLRVLRAGDHNLQLVNHRPWQPNDPAREFRLEVKADWPTGNDKPGFSARQKPLLVLTA